MPRVLIVDDEKEPRTAMVRALGDENPGWQICSAEDEGSGIKIIEEQLAKREAIDVVLTDLVMESEGSGMSLLQRARQLDPLIMAILFTAKEKSLDRYAAFDLGAFDVVEKNIMGASALREINIKTRAALRYREWSQRINFMRRYFDPRVFDLIEREPSLLAIANKTVTIAFWDIRGFSALCEALKAHPTLISGFLQEYCEMGAKAIFENAGVLDKFIGDGIMALFGVLNHKEDNGKHDAHSAVKAAIAMRTSFEELLAKWREEWELYIPNKIEIGLGCGLHTGEVLVGNVGTDFRDQFTALGANVNFASRIEARSKPGQILLSQSTESRIKEFFKVHLAGELDDIKNIAGKFEIFEIVN